MPCHDLRCSEAERLAKVTVLRVLRQLIELASGIRRAET